MNKLEEIMETQDSLNSKFGLSSKVCTQMPTNEQLLVVSKYLTVLSIEVSEAQLAAKARWWKADKDFKGIDHLKEELIDCLHLLLSPMLALGMDADEVYKKYMDKNKFNQSRKDWEINGEK